MLMNRFIIDVRFSELNERVEVVLNEHARIRKKYFLASDGPCMTKALRKAVYTRTSLRSRYNKSKSQESWNAFKKQHSRCVKMLRQAKIDLETDLSLGVPQGSVSGPLLFNMFINDFFFLVKDTEFCNYADDTTFSAYGSDMCSV